MSSLWRGDGGRSSNGSIWASCVSEGRSTGATGLAMGGAGVTSGTRRGPFPGMVRIRLVQSRVHSKDRDSQGSVQVLAHRMPSCGFGGPPSHPTGAYVRSRRMSAGKEEVHRRGLLLQLERDYEMRQTGHSVVG